MNTRMQQQQPEQMTLKQKLELIQFVAMFPALTLQLVSHRDVGSRTNKGVFLAAIVAVMLLLASISKPENRPQDLKVFAMLVLGLGVFQRFLRSREYAQGVRQHSRYYGSFPEFAIIPAWLRTERRMERFIEPTLWLGTGILLLRVSPALALWINFSALCLRLIEFSAHRIQYHQRLDTVDALTNSEIQNERVEHFTEGNQPASRRPSPGISTGLDHILRRKLGQQKNDQSNASRPTRKIGIVATIFKPKLTRESFVLALPIAVLADASYFLMHYVAGWLSGTWLGSQLLTHVGSFSTSAELVIDFVTMALLIGLLGFNYALLPAFLAQFVPIPKIPSWTLSVLYVAWQKRKESPASEIEAANVGHDLITQTPESRLGRLAELHQQGFITDEELARRRQAIINEL